MSEESALREAELEMQHAKDIDAKRLALARKIGILYGTWAKLWQSCSNRQCQRERACIAPAAVCPMQPPSSEEEMREEWPKVLVEIRRALAERRAEIEAAESK